MELALKHVAYNIAKAEAAQTGHVFISFPEITEQLTQKSKLAMLNFTVFLYGQLTAIGYKMSVQKDGIIIDLVKDQC